MNWLELPGAPHGIYWRDKAKLRALGMTSRYKVQRKAMDGARTVKTSPTGMDLNNTPRDAHC